MLLPKSCPVCGAQGRAPCDRCRAELRPAPSLPPPLGIDAAAAVLHYSGAGRELVARLKYRNARSSVTFLARAMAALVDPAAVEVVSWIPTTPARRRQRGFDHAEVLARAVARRIGRPCRPLLRRLPGPAQTGLSLAARRAGPAFVAPCSSPLSVLLVDDVVTTGATATGAARMLRAAGASRVELVSAARTPPRGVHSAMAVCGSVVESRGQPQAKRPT